jgi:YVTN family beta-propeller protein
VVEVGRNPSQAVVGGGFVWVANSGDGTLSVVDPRTNRVVDTVRIGDIGVLQAQGCGPTSVHAYPDGTYATRRCDIPSAVVVADGAVWVTKDDEMALLRLDPATRRVTNKIPLGVAPFLMAAGEGSIWVTDYEHGAVARVDTGTNSLVKVFRGLVGGPAGLAVGVGGVWVVKRSAGVVVRIDPLTNTVGPDIKVGDSPLPVAAGDAVWVRNENDATVSRIDPVTSQVVATIPVGPKEGRDGVDSLAIIPTGVWVTGMRLMRIDPSINRVAQVLKQDATTVGDGGDGSLWITDIAGRLLRIRP